MPRYFRWTLLLASALLILVALSGCGSTTRLLRPISDPALTAPTACDREHPERLSELDEGYPAREPIEKARDELRAKLSDGERYRALWLDHEACRRWLEAERAEAKARADRERRGDQ